jgi:hypothetical protein
MVKRARDGNTWRIGTAAEVAWIETCTGGPAELIDSFLRHPGLQARPVALGDQDAAPPDHQAR